MTYRKYKSPYTIPEILRLKSEGQTQRQIADHFGISSSRVGQIIKGEKHRLVSAERSAVVRSEIRTSNEFGRKLTIADLFCVLNLPKRPEAVLRTHFNRQGIDEFSLRDMMDVLIPIVEDSKGIRDQLDYEEHRRHMPAYRVKTLGQILYANMIKAVSSVDCGDAFRAEWAERKKRLRDYLGGTGGFYPYILNGKTAALREVP